MEEISSAGRDLFPDELRGFKDPEVYMEDEMLSIRKGPPAGLIFRENQMFGVEGTFPSAMFHTLLEIKTSGTAHCIEKCHHAGGGTNIVGIPGQNFAAATNPATKVDGVKIAKSIAEGGTPAAAHPCLIRAQIAKPGNADPAAYVSGRLPPCSILPLRMQDGHEKKIACTTKELFQSARPLTTGKPLAYCAKCREWTPMRWRPKSERGKRAEHWFQCEYCGGRGLTLRYLPVNEAISRNRLHRT